MRYATGASFNKTGGKSKSKSKSKPGNSRLLLPLTLPCRGEGNGDGLFGRLTGLDFCPNVRGDCFAAGTFLERHHAPPAI